MRIVTKKPPRCIRINPVNGARKLYKTPSSAARDLGLDPCTLANACAHRLGMRHYGGFEWLYTADAKIRVPGPFAGRKHTLETREKMSKAKSAKKRAVEAFTKSGRFVARYDSACAAARAMGTVRSSIHKALRNINVTAEGLVWRFV